MALAWQDPVTAEVDGGVALMIEQSHTIEGKIETMAQSVITSRPRTRRLCSWRSTP
ncbi:MAG: hypothetical protein ABR569_06285 [Gaiellaceae bacterium]